MLEIVCDTKVPRNAFAARIRRTTLVQKRGPLHAETLLQLANHASGAVGLLTQGQIRFTTGLRMVMTQRCAGVTTDHRRDCQVERACSMEPRQGCGLSRIEPGNLCRRSTWHRFGYPPYHRNNQTTSTNNRASRGGHRLVNLMGDVG